MQVITGATGYVGAHLCGQLLKQGGEVLCLRRDSSSLKSFDHILSYYQLPDIALSRLHWAFCDILDPLGLLELIQPGDQVYHCAAEVTFAAASEKQMEQVNVKGTANVVNACLEKRADKLCHVSSIGALGNSLNGEAITEESYRTHLSKNKGYGYTKYLGELEVYRGIAEGLNAVIVNPSVIIGPGDAHQGLGKIKSMLQKGLRYYPSGSSAWVDVRDVAAAMIFLMNSEVSGERFIISSENLSYREFLAFVAEALGQPAPAKQASAFMLRTAGLISTIKAALSGHKPDLSRDMVNILSAHSAYETSKYRALSGPAMRGIQTSVSESCNF